MRLDRLVEHGELDEALRLCGASWNAAQAHGFLCSRLALCGSNAASDWLDQVAAGADQANELRDECLGMLESLAATTYRQLDERQSEFAPLLPDDSSPPSLRADALAHWCEGFLHGLVSRPHPEALKARLVKEPLSDIIKDMLQITRATADATDDEQHEEASEEAYAELVEYIRVAVQLAYEELVGFRSADATNGAAPDIMH
jgi:uncharacterized protein